MADNEVDIWAVPVSPTSHDKTHYQLKYGWRVWTEMLIARQFLEKHCLHLKPKAPTDAILDTANMTLEELRNEGCVYFQEAERLSGLPERRTLYSLRVPNDKDPKFLDPKVDAVRFWALQNPHEDGFVYKEEWAKDGDKWHVLVKEKMDNPVLTARESTRS